MKVIVLGASGFIGQPVAQAFTRAGHIVYGTTRSSTTANALQKEEILPLVLDPTTDEGLKQLVDAAKSCDVVVDTIPATGPEGPLAVFKAIEAATKDRPVGSKIAYIYTGGSWVHSRGMGDLDKWTDERQPYGSGVELTQWRWKVEEVILSATSVHGIIIRPSILYGKSGSLSAMLVFGPAQKAGKGQTFKVVGRPETRLLTIHTDDLADLYVRVAERSPICKGQAFLGANPSSERLVDLYDAVVRVTGAKGYDMNEPSNPFEEAWASTTLAKASLGEALTGWRPKKMSLVDGIDTYWASYSAFSAEK